jgi:hypothetical protein
MPYKFIQAIGVESLVAQLVHNWWREAGLGPQTLAGQWEVTLIERINTLVYSTILNAELLKVHLGVQFDKDAAADVFGRLMQKALMEEKARAAQSEGPDGPPVGEHPGGAPPDQAPAGSADAAPEVETEAQ